MDSNQSAKTSRDAPTSPFLAHLESAQKHPSIIANSLLSGGRKLSITTGDLDFEAFAEPKSTSLGGTRLSPLPLQVPRSPMGSGLLDKLLEDRGSPQCPRSPMHPQSPMLSPMGGGPSRAHSLIGSNPGTLNGLEDVMSTSGEQPQMALLRGRARAMAVEPLSPWPFAGQNQVQGGRVNIFKANSLPVPASLIFPTLLPAPAASRPISASPRTRPTSASPRTLLKRLMLSTGDRIVSSSAHPALSTLTPELTFSSSLTPDDLPEYPPPTPSITANLPELQQSLKDDIFGSEAPDEVHSKAIPGFTIGRVIGDGGFCQVRIGAHHLSAQKAAIKVVDKSKIEDADKEKMIRREIRTMKHLNGHSRIIRLYMTMENDQFIYIVMELATGGTLLDYIKKQKSLQKAEAARIMAQLVSGLDYCHKRGVVHRDIKLENVMMDDRNNVKIIDLGLCAFYQPGQKTMRQSPLHLCTNTLIPSSGKKLKVFCGSPSYAAPEIIACTEYEAPPVVS